MARPVRPAAPPVRYLELATAYNRNLAKIDQLWSRADIEMRWRHRGKMQRETAEGHLMLMLPDRVALSVGKLGQTYFWAGSDAHRYWLFDLREEGTVYWGTHERFRPGIFGELPLPVRPRDVPKMMGLVYLPIHDEAQDTLLVESQGSDWVVALPQQRLILTVDPATMTARSVRLLDESGQLAVVSILDQPVAVEQEGVPSHQWPRLPRQLSIAAPDGDALIRLTLLHPSDGRAENRLRPHQFDFSFLQRVHKPRQIIDLDQRVED